MHIWCVNCRFAYEQVLIWGFHVKDNPAFFTELLDSWIGFSEQWEPSQAGIVTKNFTHLPADVPKRDAVVGAFKVRILELSNVYHVLSRIYLACVACLWWVFHLEYTGLFPC